MKINNQNIYGGNQQFADTIINSSDKFDETDKNLIKLIHENVPSNEGRMEMLKSLETVKSTDQTDKERKESGSIIKKFIDSIATEGGKQIVKELAENGSEYAKFILEPF